MTRAFAVLPILLAGCVLPTYEETTALALNTDLSVNTVASAICTRGNAPVKLAVATDGSAVGRLVGAKEDMLSGSMTAQGSRSVLLEIQPGPLADGAVREVLQPSLNRGEIMLRGDTFDCAEVRVRK